MTYPIEQERGGNPCPRKAGRLFCLEVLYHFRFLTEEGQQLKNGRILTTGGKFRRQETLDSSTDSGINKLLLFAKASGTKGWNDDILALESGLQIAFGEIRLVNRDIGWEGSRTIPAREDGNGESAGCDQALEDNLANTPTCLINHE